MLLFAAGSEVQPPPPPAEGFLESHYVDVKAFGAAGDYSVTSGVGTDDTAAIQAALNSTAVGQLNAGKIVLLTPGRYKTTAPLVLGQGMHLAAVNPIKGANVGSQGAANSSAVDFYGGPTDNCVEAIGSSGGISRVQASNLFIVDRRTSPTSGDGIHFSRVVNQTNIIGCEVHWTDGVGNGIYIGAPSGSVSDCVIVDDLWVFGGLYGLYTERIDNSMSIRDVKCDTANGSAQVAVVRISGRNTTIISNVKHENSNAATATIEIDGSGFPWWQIVDGVISRLGSGGPNVRILGGNGGGIILRGLGRQNSGTLVSHTGGTTGDKTVTGTRLAHWMGGPEAININNAVISGNAAGASTNDQLRIVGPTYIAPTATTTVTSPGALNVVPATAAGRGVCVQANPSQTGDLLRVVDSSNTDLVKVSASGGATLARDATVAGAGRSLGFYGSPGTGKATLAPAATDLPTAIVLANDIRAKLIALGLVN